MICSKEEFVEKHIRNIKQKFIERGYPINMIDEELERGLALPREDLLRLRPIYPVQASPVPPVARKKELFSNFYSDL